MALKDYIKDLTTYVTTTGFFDKIKVTAGSKEVSIEAMEKEKEVIFKGKFSKPLSDLDGEFGLSNLSLLQTITSDPEFASNDSTMVVTYEEKNGDQGDGDGCQQQLNGRAMGVKMVIEPPFQGQRQGAHADLNQIAQARDGGTVRRWHDLQRKTGNQRIAGEKSEKGQNP